MTSNGPIRQFYLKSQTGNDWLIEINLFVSAEY